MATANHVKNNVRKAERGNDILEIDLVDIFYKASKKKTNEPFDNNKKLIDSLTGIAEQSDIDSVLDNLSTEIL